MIEWTRSTESLVMKGVSTEVALRKGGKEGQKAKSAMMWNQRKVRPAHGRMETFILVPCGFQDG